ncbi:MAG TPA: T9SS type A sorting domain-containing protein, partial [Chitinophagaceae bacterium]|nr:T9SS type A sorting domain-containing protein [Chitinophagaceae bacterium]
KQHGFYTLFEIYGFPYTLLPTDFDVTAIDLHYPFPILPYKHQRMEIEMTKRNFVNVDLNWKYTLGNEWQFAGGSTSTIDLYRHDSVMSYAWLGVDTMMTTLYNETYIRKWKPGSFTDTIIHISQPFTDTFYNSQYAIVRMLIPEHKSLSPGFDPNYNINLPWYFASILCNRLLIKDTLSRPWPILGVSGYSHYGSWYLQDFGLFGQSIFTYQINANGGSSYPFYYKLGSCIGGTKMNLKILSTDDIQELSKKVILYPNPTYSSITIDIPIELEILNVSMVNIQGEKIVDRTKFPNSHQMDISDYPSGIYFLELKTNKGIINKKIVKY